MQSDRPELDDDLAAARYRSLFDDLQDLKDEARAYVTAEVDFQKARVAFAGRAIARAALFGLLAIVLIIFAIMALVLGLILALTPLLGAWGAMGVVFGALLLFTLLFAVLAVSRVKRMITVINGEEGST